MLDDRSRDKKKISMDQNTRWIGICRRKGEMLTSHTWVKKINFTSIRWRSTSRSSSKKKSWGVLMNCKFNKSPQCEKAAKKGKAILGYTEWHSVQDLGMESSFLI